MSPDAVVYLASALLGALIGGLSSFTISARGARRERRSRYGERLLTTLERAHHKLSDAAERYRAEGGPPGGVALRAREEAIALWAQTELAAILEWSAGRRAMQHWGHRMHDLLATETVRGEELARMEEQLDLGVYLVVAWTARHARGRDFALDDAEIARHFAPR